MRTADLKSTLHQLIEGINDNATLEALYTLLKGRNKISSDEWEAIPEEVRKDIDISIKQMESGEVFSHEEVLTELSKRNPNLKF